METRNASAPLTYPLPLGRTSVNTVIDSACEYNFLFYFKQKKNKTILTWMQDKSIDSVEPDMPEVV